MKLEALVLAAGCARRFGQVKQVHTIHGKPLLRYIVDALLTAELPVTVVLGHAADTVRGVLGEGLVRHIVHPHWVRGMGSSLAYGVADLAARDIDAVLICLGDQIAVTSQDIERLRNAAVLHPDHIVTALSGGRSMPPCLFPRRFFAELAQLDDDQGARQILRRHARVCVSVDVPNARYDVDTLDDLESGVRPGG